MSNEARVGDPRPEGIAGLLIDEIELKGIWRTPKGYVAQVISNQKSYLLRAGDQLWDGDVVVITKCEMTLKQILAGGKMREVVKTL